MYRIGVYGTAEQSSPELEQSAAGIGRVLAERDCIVITGACSGLPYRAARTAAELGTAVWGFSPMRDVDGQRRFTPDDDLSIYSRLHFIPSDFPLADDIEIAKKYRNVVSTARCDAGIIISGRWGTLHEVCSLIDYGKVVGVLQGSGGVADELKEMWERLDGRSSGALIAHGDPVTLVREIVKELDRRKLAP